MPAYWYRTDPALRREIARRVDNLSLEEWGLSPRTLNALLLHDPDMTAGDIVRADSRLARIPGIGGRAIDELDAKVSQLLADPEGFLTRRSRAAEQAGEFPEVAHAVLPHQQLPASVLALPIAELHLRRGSFKGLSRAGILAVSDLIDADRLSAERAVDLGLQTFADATRHLAALQGAITPDGELDWFAYLREVEVEVLPVGSGPDTDASGLVAGLPALFRELVLRRYQRSGEREWLVLSHRFEIDGARRMTLEDLGEQLGVTRERVRQIEHNVLGYLAEALVLRRYAGRTFHVHPTLLRVLAEARPGPEAGGRSGSLERLRAALGAYASVPEPYLRLLVGVYGVRNVRDEGEDPAS